MKYLLRASLFLVFFVALCLPAPASAQAVTVVHSFGDGSVAQDGTSPISSLIQASDGTIYGTTEYGGSTANNGNNGYGTVFRVNPGSPLTVLHSFSDGTVANDGKFPNGLIQGNDGILYGTTVSGGSANHGTVFMMTPNGTETILHSFGDGSVYADGMSPYAGLVQDLSPTSPTYGWFYGTTGYGGTTAYGGSNGDGTIFRINASGSVAIVHDFHDYSVFDDGIVPTSALIQGTDGNFYGTTPGGGAAGYGTIYVVTPTSQLTLLHSFGDGTTLNDGLTPYDSLVLGSDGNFYGTTYYGGSTRASGSSGYGTVFEMTPGGVVTTLHSFRDGTVTNDGFFPRANLAIGDDGNYYGTTVNGGSTATPGYGNGQGAVFEMTPTGTVIILHSFGDGSVANDGISPQTGLLFGYDGSFYGTTPSGGSTGHGTLYNVGIPPFIANLAPNPVLAGGPSFTLAVSGGFYVPGATVNFNGAPLPTTWTSSKQVDASVPANDIGAAGTAQITVSNPATLYINNPSPAISSLSPASATENSGDFTLTINGAGFTQASTVTFGSDTLTSVSITSTAITVSVPNADIQTPGTITVTVTNPVPGGGSASATFTITSLAPTITRFSPPSAVIDSGPFTLTICGSNFNSSSTVSFGTDTLTPTSQSSTSLAVTVPNSDIQNPGNVVVTVTNPGIGSAKANFQVNNPVPVITYLSPPSEIMNSGSFTLTIDGSGFLPSSTVVFGTDTLTPTMQTPTAITVTVPNSDIQNLFNVTVTVTNPGPGGGTGEFSFLVTDSAPSITSLSPLSVLVNSGDFTLTISGSGFNQFSAVSFVPLTLNFSGGPITLTPTSVSSTDIVVTVPNTAIQMTGSTTITVTNPGPGGGASTGNFVVASPVPSITSLSPGSVVANSGSFSLTINGSGFAPTASVSFGGVPLQASVVNENTITALVMNSDIEIPGTVQLTVTNPPPGGGEAVVNYAITNPSPAITSLSPSSATANSGAFTLTINGSGFLSSSTVTFGSDTLTPTSVTSSAITVTVPNSDIQAAGTPAVTVTNPAPGGGSASANFTVTTTSNNPAPTISSLSPSSVVANSGNFTLTINGSNFTSTSKVTFGRSTLSILSEQPNVITVTVPNGDIPSPGAATISVTNPAPGGGTASARLTVTAP